MSVTALGTRPKQNRERERERETRNQTHGEGKSQISEEEDGREGKLPEKMPARPP
jgi:hypothetical protein